jgi:hypothetical protein
MQVSWSLEQLAAWRQKNTVSSDGARLGEVKAIYYDYLTGEPVWIAIGTGLLGIRTFLVPAASASPEGDQLRIEHTRGFVEGQPDADIGEGFDYTSEEHELYDYFKMPFDEKADLRALHPGDEIPGRERNV